jgi:hypothetical protein
MLDRRSRISICDERHLYSLLPQVPETHQSAEETGAWSKGAESQTVPIAWRPVIMLTNQQKAVILQDFQEWNGGDYPESQREVEIYVECSYPMPWNEAEVAAYLSSLINESQN